MKTESLRVVVVDDDVLACEALRLCLSEGGLDVVAVAHGWEDGLAAIVNHKPAVVVWDDSLPGPDGGGAVTRLRQVAPHVPLLVMVSGYQPTQAVRLLEAGASGLITKDRIDLRLLPDQIRLIAKGERALVQTSVLRDLISTLPTTSIDPPVKHNGNFPRDIEALSELEFEVLRLVFQRWSYQEIAAELALDAEGVNAVGYSICMKLGVRNHADLVKLGQRIWLANDAPDEEPS